MNGAEGLTGSCKACGTTLDRALVREVRHYEETRLLEVTCAGCERRFLAIQVETLATTLETLTEAGLGAEPLQYPGGPHGPKTSWLTDPDGYRIELVEWPSGHADGITAADFA